MLLTSVLAGIGFGATCGWARSANLDFLQLDSRAESFAAPRDFTPLTPPVASTERPSFIRGPVGSEGGGVLQCVPYARKISGIQIRGDAHSWWAQAAGRYARGNVPRVGAVLALRASGAMPLGHVATVSRIDSARQIRLDHANWSGPGVVERNVIAADVSPANDWSQVRIWYGPIGKLGSRINPAHGFIYPAGPGIAAPPVRHAAVSDVPDAAAVRRVDRAARRLAKAERRRERAAPRLDYDLRALNGAEAVTPSFWAAR